MYAEITAINHGVPEGIQTAEHLSPLIGKTPEWIQHQTGVLRRHTSLISDDPAALASKVAKPLIQQRGHPDLIIHAGAMPRQLLPDMSVFINRELGLNGVPGYTINATCLSFLTALQVATSLIQSGANKKVLICSSEFATRGRNFEEPEAACLMGDAAAAAIVECSERPSGIQHYMMETWPAAAEFAEVRGGGVMRPPNQSTTTAADNLFHMQGDRLLKYVLPRLRKFLQRFELASGVPIEDIPIVVPHQESLAGMKILDRLGIRDDRVVNILADYGNCVSASIPMALSLAQQQGRLQRDEFALLLGTAAGISMGAALIRW